MTVRLRITPGVRVGGEAVVPGDKSIAHRWLLLAATADGPSRLRGLPDGLDVRATASCLAKLARPLRPRLEAWAERPGPAGERHGSTWNQTASTLDVDELELEAQGRDGLGESETPLDCRNSGTTMRLLCGVLAGRPHRAVLVGDRSLSSRPMERVAEPLRRMGADVTTDGGHPPIAIRGGRLAGIVFESDVASAQVKSAVLLAGLAADGSTAVREPITTRDHTERALAALGAPIATGPAAVELRGPFQHGGLEGAVPGDPSSAAFLLAGAALTGGALVVRHVCLNPTRLGYVDVMRRMGVRIALEVERHEVGEPVGRLSVEAPAELAPVHVDAAELPLVIDEVPMLAALAVHASGSSRFEGAAELRMKESDRLATLVDGVRGLGGDASVEGDALTVGGGGLAGGEATGAADHRIAMALAVAALAADGVSVVDGIEAAEVSYPGFVPDLERLGAAVEDVP